MLVLIATSVFTRDTFALQGFACLCAWELGVKGYADDIWVLSYALPKLRQSALGIVLLGFMLPMLRLL